MKPRVFIGSSSAAIHSVKCLVATLSDQDWKITPWFVSEPWKSGNSNWGNLTRASQEFDFAIFLYTPDDKVANSPGEVLWKSRDNVNLEFGLFTGRLERNRVFILKQSDGEGIVQLPSDLNGQQYFSFRAADQETGMITPAKALTTTINQVWSSKPNSYTDDLSPASIERIFEVTGMSLAFKTRNNSMNEMLKDIAAAKSSIRMYSRVYLSELVKNLGGFEEAVSEALSKTEDRLIISSTTTNPNIEELVKGLYSLEDPKRKRWELLNEYRAHIKTATNTVESLRDHLHASQDIKEPSRIVFEIKMIDEIMPYSMLVIDKSIVYVSFYKLSPTASGTQAPTVRLVDNRKIKDWADTFIKQAELIDGISLHYAESSDA